MFQDDSLDHLTFPMKWGPSAPVSHNNNNQQPQIADMFVQPSQKWNVKNRNGHTSHSITTYPSLVCKYQRKLCPRWCRQIVRRSKDIRFTMIQQRSAENDVSLEKVAPAKSCIYAWKVTFSLRIIKVRVRLKVGRYYRSLLASHKLIWYCIWYIVYGVQYAPAWKLFSG